MQNEVSKAAVSKSGKVWKNYIFETLLRASLLITLSGTNFKVNSPRLGKVLQVFFFFFSSPLVSTFFLVAERERERARWGGEEEGRGGAWGSWAGGWVVFLQGQIKGSWWLGSAVPTDPSPGHPLAKSKTLFSPRRWAGQTQRDGYPIHQIHGARVKHPKTHTPNWSGDEETKAQQWQLYRPGSQKQVLCISSLALPPEDVGGCYIVNKYPKCETDNSRAIQLGSETGQMVQGSKGSLALSFPGLWDPWLSTDNPHVSVWTRMHVPTCAHSRRHTLTRVWVRWKGLMEFNESSKRFMILPKWTNIKPSIKTQCWSCCRSPSHSSDKWTYPLISGLNKNYSSWEYTVSTNLFF